MTKSSKQYEVIGMGLHYPSVKDGKTRFRATGDIIDDLPPTDIPHLLAEEQIVEHKPAKAETGDVAVGAGVAEAAADIPEEG